MKGGGYVIDFSYRGEKLSDYGCIVASINTTFQDSVPIGSNLVLETIKNHATHINKIINTDYNDVVSATFDICKNPCLYKTNKDMVFSDIEISFFARWLNQKKYYKFKPIYENGMYSDLYFYGTFTSISSIIINDNTIGFTLTFTSNSPFGYVDDKEFTVSLDNKNNSFVFYDDSDEIGSLYPNLFQIQCKSNGKLEIQNDQDKRATIINNCVNGEIISMDCGNKIIKSSELHPNLFNDFNYNYPRIINDANDRCNTYTVSIPCNILIKYSPIRKAGIIV